MNGVASTDDADDSADDAGSINSLPPHRANDTRSVSSTVHDRARSTPSGPAAVAATSARRPSSPAPKAPHHHSRHAAQPQAGTSAAKETFLNYFFGQNGPGPLAGASVDRATAAGMSTITPVGRDLSGSDSALQTGLMAGNRNLEGNNAAFDMKSLGKHIEAISVRGSFDIWAV